MNKNLQQYRKVILRQLITGKQREKNIEHYKRCHSCHVHRHYNKRTPQLDSSIDTYVNLIDSIDQPQGVHKIKTMLFSISLPKVRELQSLAQESTNYDYESA